MSSLVDSWPSLLALLKDAVPLGLPAPGQFLILGLVSLPSLLFNCHTLCLYSLTSSCTVIPKISRLFTVKCIHNADVNESVCSQRLRLFPLSH